MFDHSSLTFVNTVEWWYSLAHRKNEHFTTLLQLDRLYVLSEVLINAHTLCKHVRETSLMYNCGKWIIFKQMLYPRIICPLPLFASWILSCNAILHFKCVLFNVLEVSPLMIHQGTCLSIEFAEEALNREYFGEDCHSKLNIILNLTNLLWRYLSSTIKPFTKIPFLTYLIFLTYITALEFLMKTVKHIIFTIFHDLFLKDKWCNLKNIN